MLTLTHFVLRLCKWAKESSFYGLDNPIASSGDQATGRPGEQS
jgi:hypothetical protein